ncbi:hypothetical protein BDR07DRAFT_1423555 [Suillus spraguei]|nr:hypothetical protein BDR07DRAFT_1423555 [Suillus spraguei]
MRSVLQAWALLRLGSHNLTLFRNTLDTGTIYPALLSRNNPKRHPHPCSLSNLVLESTTLISDHVFEDLLGLDGF